MTTEARSAGSGLGKNILLALASILATLLACEVAFRVLGHLENRGILDHATPLGIEPPEDGPADLGHLIRRSANERIIYELKPGLDVEYSGTRVTTDGEGFRGRSSPAEVAEAGYRIVGIGDSFMFGHGVEARRTYLGVLETRLRRHRRDLDARILNTAVPGYNTVMEVATLEEKGLAYRPHLVLIEFVGNDLELPNFIRTPSDVWGFDRSFLVDFFERRRGRRKELSLFGRLERLGLTPGLDIEAERVPAEYRGMVGFEAYVGALRELRELSLEHGFEVLWFTLLAPGNSQRQMIAVSADLGFHVLDVGTVLRDYLDERGLGDYLGSPLALGPDDGHPSVAGHRVAAGALYRYLESFVLPPPS